MGRKKSLIQVNDENVKLLKKWRAAKPSLSTIRNRSFLLESLTDVDNQELGSAVDKLVESYKLVSDARTLVDIVDEIGRKKDYTKFGEVWEDIYRRGNVEIDDVYQLVSGFNSALNKTISRIDEQFGILANNLEQAKEQDQISDLTIKLEKVASYYQTLDTNVGIEGNRIITKKPNKDLGKYSQFVEDKKPLDAKLQRFVESYKPSDDLSFGDFTQLWGEIKGIEKAYKSIVSKYTSWLSRNFSDKPSLFGCYGELSQVEKLKNEIGYFKSNFKRISKAKQDINAKISNLNETLSFLNDNSIQPIERLRAVKPNSFRSNPYANLRGLAIPEHLFEDFDRLSKECDDMYSKLQEDYSDTLDQELTAIEQGILGEPDTFKAEKRILNSLRQKLNNLEGIESDYRLLGKPTEKVDRLKDKVEEQIEFYKDEITEKERKNQEFLRDAKQQIEDWMDDYRDILDYLSKGNDVIVKHVDTVAGFELVDPILVNKWKQNKYLSDDVEELLDLGDVVVDRIGKEVSRIEQDLEQGVGAIEKNYLVDAKDVDEMQELIPRLDSSIKSLDELALMYKLLGEPTKSVDELRKKVEKRIDFYNRGIEEHVRKREAQTKRASQVVASQTSQVETEELTTGYKLFPESYDGRKRTEGFTGEHFDLLRHFILIDDPPVNYQKFEDIMLGRTGKQHWIERLQSVKQILNKTPQASCWKDLDYMYHFEYALAEDMNRGNMNHLVSTNSIYRQIARETLSELSNYIKSSESTIGLSPKQIEAHRAVFGPENAYNKAFRA